MKATLMGRKIVKLDRLGCFSGGPLHLFLLATLLWPATEKKSLSKILSSISDQRMIDPFCDLIYVSRSMLSIPK